MAKEVTYKFTREGEAAVDTFIANCKAKRKEILDAGIDTADETTLPDKEAILQDIVVFIEPDNTYCNGWGVTDNYDSDAPLYLEKGKDFVEV